MKKVAIFNINLDTTIFRQLRELIEKEDKRVLGYDLFLFRIKKIYILQKTMGDKIFGKESEFNQLIEILGNKNIDVGIETQFSKFQRFASGRRFTDEVRANISFLSEKGIRFLVFNDDNDLNNLDNNSQLKDYVDSLNNQIMLFHYKTFENEESKIFVVKTQPLNSEETQYLCCVVIENVSTDDVRFVRIPIKHSKEDESMSCSMYSVERYENDGLVDTHLVCVNQHQRKGKNFRYIIKKKNIMNENVRGNMNMMNELIIPQCSISVLHL
jgi:hypothetical protein